MKLYLAAALACPALAYNMGVYDMFGRPILVSPGRASRFGRGRYAANCSPRQNGNNMRNQPGDCVDRAFEDLANELNTGRSRRRQGGGRAPGSSFRSPPMDEQSLRKQQEWLNRAFGLATDVASGMAASPEEAKQNAENVRKQQEFVNRFFGFAKDIASGNAYSSVRFEVVKDNDEEFVVDLDVPGVRASDINVTVEGEALKVLSVRAKREVGKDKDGKPLEKILSSNFPLDKRSNLENISASLSVGVLRVAVPKKVEETKKEESFGIPVTQASADELIDDDSFLRFEVDVPGVAAKAINVVLENLGTRKILKVSAFREIGKESDGTPRNKRIERSFNVDDMVDETNTRATLDNGVLSVFIAKDKTQAEKRAGKSIPITSGFEDQGKGEDDSAN